MSILYRVSSADAYPGLTPTRADEVMSASFGLLDMDRLRARGRISKKGRA